MAGKNVDEIYPLSDATDTLTTKDWAGGSAVPEEFEEIVVPADGDKNPVLRVTYSPRFTKLVDEVVVNALDHIIRCFGTPTPVNRIDIVFGKDGSVSVHNTGKGIPVAIHQSASAKYGHTMYVPEFIMGVLFQGSNAVKPPDCIIGGTNGIGAKLANANSLWFTIETHDETRGLHYRQTWTGNMRTCEPPTITPAAKATGTRISFMPDYKLLGMTPDAETLARVGALMRHRAITAAVYAHFAAAQVGQRPPVVTYNGGSLAHWKRPIDIAQSLFPDCQAVTARVRPEPAKSAKQKNALIYTMEWECAVVMIDPETKLEYDNISVINGVIARGGGHIAHVRDLVTQCICNSLKGKINDSDMERARRRAASHVFIVLYCQIPNPGWEGQRKDVLSFTKAKFSHYTMESKGVTAIASTISDAIAAEFTQTAGKDKKTKVTIAANKYSAAIHAGKKSVKNKVLILTEGISAKIAVEMAGLPRDRFGILALDGVIMNAGRESTVTESEDGQYVKTNKKFDENKTLNNLISVLGLSITKNYIGVRDPELNYDSILLLVDQDLDGKGCILGLVLSMFAKLWRGLFDIGFLKWLATPILRAIPKGRTPGDILSFYSLEDFRKWFDSTPGAESKYEITYYKGLARHTRLDWVSMIATMDQHTFTYTYDAVTQSRWFDIYFGDDPDKRKVALRHVPLALNADQMALIDRTRKIPCSTHLRIDTHAFQLDNLDRKLAHVIDGQNQAGRKILHSIVRRLKRGQTMKVSQFAGAVSLEENYHHGEAVMEGSLFCRMQRYPGGVQLPLIRDCGMAGARVDGGKTHGSSRYVCLTDNARLTTLLFPADDYNLLDFNFEDGKRCEPKYFCPIIPMAICESTCLPAHGWKLELWARDVKSVINAIRTRIALDSTDYMSNRSDHPELPVYTYRNITTPWTGEVFGDTTYGKWTVQGNLIIITELPLRTWTLNYLVSLQKRAEKAPHIYESVHNLSAETVHIEVRLRPGVIDGIHSNGEDIGEFLKLYDVMYHNINLMGHTGAVIEYERYIDVLNAWYPHRRSMYTGRVDRLSIMYRLRIGYYENIVRYITESNGLGFAKRTVPEMIESLTAGGYTKYKRPVINDPGFIPTDQIVQAATGDDANYDYLIDLSDRNKSAESLAKYQEKLAEIQREYDQHEADCAAGPFRGSMHWRKELDQLEAVYDEGCATGWTFGDSIERKYA